LARIQRRHRAACRLKCEILVSGPRRVRGRVVSISEGGLAVIADLDLQPGDPIRLMLEPELGTPVKVSGIVWSDLSASPSGRSSQIRKFGCVVSEPTRPFRALLEALAPGVPARRTVPVPLAPPRAVEPAGFNPDLPRSRELQPPPKLEPQERIPYFKVRLRQIGAPRTRILTLRARSATEAERIALDELDQTGAGPEAWGVLNVACISRG